MYWACLLGWDLTLLLLALKILHISILFLLARPLTPTCNYVSGPPPTSLLEQQNFRNIAIRMRIFHMQLCMAALVPLLILLVFTRYFL